ncbi:MAG: hypothetical protein JSU68_09270 [Phycisphaerales bacterium]|nr:MAG: hypothetical protein JSU68_09270 [Phycisphaerales bacterium]
MSKSVEALDPLPGAGQSAAPLLLASFLVSQADGALMVGLPYLSLSMGGTASQVGLVGGLMRLCYVIGLLTGRHLLDRAALGWIAVCGCCGLAATTLVMPSMPTLGPLFGVVALYGLATALFWPPLVGLLFAGHQGQALNRRLGQFNVAWSAGMVTGPWLGGELFGLAPGLAFWASVGMFAAAGVCLAPVARTSGRGASAQRSGGAVEESSTAKCDDRTILFHRMAQVSLIGGYLVLGLLRYQLPNLAKELEIGSATFGRVGTVLSLSLAAAFYLLGRAARWHYLGWLFWGGQVVMAASLLVLLRAANAYHMTWCVLVAGQGIGLVYSSHLYYGSSASGHRALVMTRHEVLLSLGFLLGAYGGGLIADQSNNRALYAVGFVVILAGVAVQVGMWLLAGGRWGKGQGNGRATDLPQ